MKQYEYRRISEEDIDSLDLLGLDGWHPVGSLIETIVLLNKDSSSNWKECYLYTGLMIRELS